MITNKYNFPKSIVRAVENDSYTRGKADISVTQLIAPPQIVYLRHEAEKRGQKPQEDVSDRIWSLLGQAVHHVLERAVSDDAVAEQRWFADIEDWTLSGQIDLLEDGILTDFKVTSVWSVKEAIQFGKIEWAEQLNVLKWLYDDNTHDEDEELITALQIVAICRDWRRGEAMRYDDYPQQAVTIPVEMWTKEERQAFVEKKIADHKEARAGNPRPCTDSERWMTNNTYAVMKEGRKSALRVLDSEIEAQAWIAQTNPKGKISIEFRQGEYKRCAEYCEVAPLCPQYQDEP